MTQRPRFVEHTLGGHASGICELAGYSARFRPYLGGDGKAGFVDIDCDTFMGAYSAGELIPVYSNGQGD